MIGFGRTEDLSQSTKEYLKVFFTVQIDENHYIDVMISEKDKLIYSMQNEDGSTIYDDKGIGCHNFKYDEDQVFQTAINTFETSYGRIPNISWHACQERQ